MEFRFNLNEIFKTSISRINYTLLPSNFSGDRRNAQHYVAQVADIIDAMGYAAAKAQELHHPITTADKMRNVDHTVYLMIDPINNNGKGSVVGFLKVGMKSLFLFDENGMLHEKETLCILDFYVHESKQRTGCGKKIYDSMLHDKNIVPNKQAIDGPTEKLLSFLYKHYGLAKIYPQNNNFVLFEGFFNDKYDKNESVGSRDHSIPMDHVQKDDLNNLYDNHSVNSDEFRPALYGRHTALKPVDTMDKIIGRGSTSSKQSPSKNGV